MPRPDAIEDPLWQHAKLIHLLQVARSQLNTPAITPYIEATHRYLQQHLTLIETLAIHFADSGLQHYSQRLNETSPDRIDQPTVARAKIVQSKIVQHLQQWLEVVFQHNHLWWDMAAELWANVLTWSVLELETPIGESAIQSLGNSPFRLDLWEQLFNPVAITQPPVIASLDAVLSPALMEQLSQALQLDAQSVQTLAQFLGLQLDFQSEWPLPLLSLPPSWALCLNPFESNSSAGTPRENDIPELPAPLNQPTHSPDPILANPLAGAASPIHLEHYLTRPSDLNLTPWELVAQLKQRCGLAPVQLQFLFAAHARRQTHGLNTIFTLKASDILEQLDWLPQPQSSMPPPDLNHLVQQLADLVVTSVWMTDPKVTDVEAFHMNGHPWEIFSEIRGNFDWTTGQIQTSEEMYFTLRPGLWMYQLIQQGGKSVQRSFDQFGQFALKVLQLDYCRDPFLLSLLIHLVLSQPAAEKRDQPLIDTVENLLEAALGHPGEPANLTETEALLHWWNQALESLLDLGWSPPAALESEPKTAAHFYLQPCPKWLITNNRKPSDWFDQWLAQPVCFGSPPFALYPSAPSSATVADRSGDITPTQRDSVSQSRSPVQPQAQMRSDPAPRRRLRFDRLTGSEIRSARKALRLTQSQLAEVLNVHQSLIAKIETGDRAITDDLERSLREVLQL